jgi:hypothetical protein
LSETARRSRERRFVRNAELAVSEVRGKLIRENFELERDFHYWEFRQAHWNQAEIVATLPDLAEREGVLRDFWQRAAEKRFPEYRAAVASSSQGELEAEKEQWLDRLGCLSTKQYQEILAEAAGRAPANDNQKELER